MAKRQNYRIYGYVDVEASSADEALETFDSDGFITGEVVPAEDEDEDEQDEGA